jgi:hypothetical protein
MPILRAIAMINDYNRSKVTAPPRTVPPAPTPTPTVTTAPPPTMPPTTVPAPVYPVWVAAGGDATRLRHQHGSDGRAPGLRRHHDLIEIAGLGIDRHETDHALVQFRDADGRRRYQFMAPARAPPVHARREIQVRIVLLPGPPPQFDRSIFVCRQIGAQHEPDTHCRSQPTEVWRSPGCMADVDDSDLVILDAIVDLVPVSDDRKFVDAGLIGGGRYEWNVTEKPDAPLKRLLTDLAPDGDT